MTSLGEKGASMKVQLDDTDGKIYLNKSQMPLFGQTPQAKSYQRIPKNQILATELNLTGAESQMLNNYRKDSTGKNRSPDFNEPPNIIGSAMAQSKTHQKI